MSLRLKVGFGVLCLWSSLGWMAGDLLPVGMGSMAGEGLRLLLIGLSGTALGLVARSGDGWRALARIAGFGLVLVGLPALLLETARGQASASLGVVAFTLVPVGVMIIDGGMRHLPWGLAGVAGMLLLLPITVPETGRGLLGMGLVAVAAGLTVAGLMGMRRLLPGLGLAGAVGAVGLGSGVLLMLAGALTGTLGWRWDGVGAEMVRAAVVDLPELLLLLWLVREVSPLRVSARYLVAPLLTVVEGWWLVRGGIGVRMALGMTLLAAGAYGLLGREAGTEETGLALL